MDAILSKSLTIIGKKAGQSKLEKLLGLGVVVSFFIPVNARGLNLFKNIGKHSSGVSEHI